MSEFLRYIVEGEQEKAEGLLKETPSLSVKKGRVMDLSKREFKSITGFQYAVWALDWHMWKMLLKYMTKEAAALQFQELEDKGTAHGKYFSLKHLIEAFNTYVKNYDTWEEGQCESYWCRQVGRAQFLLPVHVVQEYCHESRSFNLCPKFNEEERSMGLITHVGNWYAAKYNGGKLGEKFGYVRGGARKSKARRGMGCGGMKDCLMKDAEAVQNLSTIRQQQLKELRIELHYVMAVKELLNTHVLSDVSSLVLTYF